jgi:hypothetical protein
MRLCTDVENNSKAKLQAYLILLVVSLFKVGCRIESSLRLCWLMKIMASHCLREIPSLSAPTYAALSSMVNVISAIRFDSNFYPIGVDCHASRCMANATHLFEDLKLEEVGGVKGIKQGLDIKGVGSFKFKLEDDNGKMHKIKIPNSLFVPNLKRCLLSSQHWTQEVGDKYPMLRGTRVEQDDENCILIWGRQNTRNRYHMIPHPTYQSCTGPLHCVSIVRLPPPLRHLKQTSSNRRRSSNFLGADAPLMSPTFFLKNLWQKKMSTTTGSQSR